MRIGKSADSIFRKTTAPKKQPATKRNRSEPKTTAAAAERKGGRAPHAEAWSRVNVVLMDRQTVALDRLAGDIRLKTGAALSRAEIIRALVDAFSDSRLDVSSCASEAEIRATVGAKLKR